MSNAYSVRTDWATHQSNIPILAQSKMPHSKYKWPILHGVLYLSGLLFFEGKFLCIRHRLHGEAGQEATQRRPADHTQRRSGRDSLRMCFISTYMLLVGMPAFTMTTAHACTQRKLTRGLPNTPSVHRPAMCTIKPSHVRITCHSASHSSRHNSLTAHARKAAAARDKGLAHLGDGDGQQHHPAPHALRCPEPCELQRVPASIPLLSRP